MHTQTFYVQTENHTSEIVHGIVETARNVQPTIMFSSIAYTSLAGVRLLNEQLDNAIPNWNDITKNWLIGLDRGITDPESLRNLASLPNSNVHLFDADYLLNNNLNPRLTFHTKVYFFESIDGGVFGMFSGSPNLTLSGLVLNTEQATSIVFRDVISPREKHALNSLREQKKRLDDIFDQNAEFSPELYNRYRELCGQRQEVVSNEDDHRTPEIVEANRPEFDLDKAASIAVASNFWVEIRYVVENLGRGLPGNQIDLQRGSRVFFGFDVGVVPRNTVFGTISILHNGLPYDCGMRFGNNSMDKLNLPAPHNIGLDTYVDKVLLFTRQGNDRFHLQIFPLDDIENFRNLSNRYNTLFEMQSGREYGVY
jgi:HKD family nuclease